MNWKFLISAILIVGAMFIAVDLVQLDALSLTDVPLGAYPIPFSNGVKEALADMSEDSSRSFIEKFPDAPVWLDKLTPWQGTSQPVIAGVT